ncbi:MAG: serine--tRNA ligase [Bdellovibrionota bacterium]
MFELKDLADNFNVYEKAWRRRNLNPESFQSIQKFLVDRKDLIQKKEGFLADRNKASELVAQKKKAGEPIDDLILQQKELGPKLKDAEAQLNRIESELFDLVARLPNLPQDSVPDGKSDEDNVEVHRWGELPSFDFEPLSHEVLGERRGWMDFDRATKISGARFSVLKGAGARLERALIQMMLDIHTKENSYEEISPPYIVNEKSLFGTGNLPKFKEDLFHLESSDFFLIPTAEVPLTNLHAQDILSFKDLPRYYTAFTPCFRSEAGSYGKDLKGLIRQHQFHKVELVKLVQPERSDEEHEKMRRDAEKILEKLELPYRTRVLCTGDMGFASSKTYDLEVWLPSQNQYREISSVSNCHEFQARRMMTRFRDEDGKLRYVHTLNGSGLAIGRTLIAILENFQNQDGRVSVPQALQPYLGGDKFL